MTHALLFVLSGAAIVAAGTALARHADAVAEKTGLGRVWVGAVLLAAATSLPELATDVAAVRLGAPNLAVGDLFGSSMANMLILALLDLGARQKILRRATPDHALSACLAVVLTTLAVLFVVIRPRWSFLGVGLAPAALVATYVAGTRAIYRHATRNGVTVPPGAREGGPGLRGALVRFGLAAVVLLAVAPLFARSAQGVAEITGLGTSFTGVLFVGLATSLPELSSSLAAVRLGAYDLAVGNLFGSNGFNMAVFFVLDLANPSGPLFTVVDPVHVVSGLFGVLLTGLGLAAVVYRAQKRFAMVEPDSLLIAAAYVAGLVLIRLHGAAG